MTLVHSLATGLTNVSIIIVVVFVIQNNLIVVFVMVMISLFDAVI